MDFFFLSTIQRKISIIVNSIDFLHFSSDGTHVRSGFFALSILDSIFSTIFHLNLFCVIRRYQTVCSSAVINVISTNEVYQNEMWEILCAQKKNEEKSVRRKCISILKRWSFLHRTNKRWKLKIHRWHTQVCFLRLTYCKVIGTVEPFAFIRLQWTNKEREVILYASLSSKIIHVLIFGIQSVHSIPWKWNERIISP